MAHLYATELFARELKQSKQELDDGGTTMRILSHSIIKYHRDGVSDLVIQKYYPPDRQAQLLGTPFGVLNPNDTPEV